uniref:type II secretion system F family protein n=1 Tax=Pseudomonas sp. RIT-To-2 TaxID=3462541 RepID=UPI00241328A1
MATFRYRALDADGATQKGNLEAADERVALAHLQARGWLVLNLEAGSQRLSRGSVALNGAALVSFTQQLATLLGAGQPLERSLGILLKQTQAPKAHALIERIREQVKAGKPLSQALEE